MSFTIDDRTYRKDLRKNPFGFGLRPNGVRPSSGVIHTTNNPKPTSFEFEAEYLYDSKLVSAHFLVGKAGEIAMLVPPDLEAWHAGVALSAWLNARSIGIEHVVSVGEQWTPIMHDASTWLCQQLMSDYSIPATMIETHRRVAVPGPDKRKHDPEAFDDAAFYAWRGTLSASAPLPVVQHYACRGLPVYQQQLLSGPVAGWLAAGEPVEIDMLYSNGAGHVSGGRLANAGFVDMKGLVNV